MHSCLQCLKNILLCPIFNQRKNWNCISQHSFYSGNKFKCSFFNHFLIKIHNNNIWSKVLIIVQPIIGAPLPIGIKINIILYLTENSVIPSAKNTLLKAKIINKNNIFDIIDPKIPYI